MINRVKENYTIITNEVLSNPNLSLKAKGLYAYLCSKPESWQFSYDGLTHQLQEGTKALRSAVKELVEAELLLRIPVKNGNNFNGWEWIINPTEEDLKTYIDPSQNKENQAKKQNGKDLQGNHPTGSYQKGNDQKGNLISNNKQQILKSNKEKNKKNIKKSFLLELLENYNIQLLLKEMNLENSQLAELLEYRKELKKPLKTIRGVIAMLRNIQATMRTHQKSFDEVFEIMAENEWQSIKPEYIANLQAQKRQSSKKDIVEANISEAQKAIAMRKARLAKQQQGA